MEQINLIKRNGTQIKLFSKDPFRTVKTATQSKSLMGVDTVTLSILSREIISFDKGDRINVNGENYYIRTKVNRELTSEGYFKYDAIFYGVLYDLMKTPYRDMDASGNSHTSTFDLVYDLKEYIRVLINNTNKDYPNWWVFDETGCPDKDPIPFQFSCNNCLEVLQQVCQKFKVDFRITQNNNVRTIQIGHFGSNITPPDGSSFFEWGRGKGLYSLKENKVDDKSIKTRLWVEGGTSNLPTGYRNYAMRLQLPLRRKNKNEHTLSDGTVIAANSEYIGISNENARYIEDTALSHTLGVDADSVLYDEIVPTRTGTVTAIYSGGETPDYLSFADSSMDFDINDHLVNNVSAKVTFITGKLAGQELEISKYDATNKKFTLIPFQDSRGLNIPTEDNDAFRIEVGNKYKLTDIVMPESVIDDAEENLWYAGYDDLCNLKQARVQYSMELNRMKLLEDLPTDSDTVLFNPGDYVPVKDTRFGVQKNIRIQKVDRNLLLRHDYHLTISDTATIDLITQSVVNTQNHEVIVINNQLRDLTKKRRGWRTTEELRTMVFDTDGYFDTDNFKANSIDTNMLTVGSKSQQFVLSGVVIQPNFDGNKNRIKVSAGSLVHLTIDDNARIWNLQAYDATMGNTTGYYLYARCAKSGNNGVWLVTQTRYKADPDGDYYYFLIGIIGSANDASGGHTAYRDFTTTYGFTRINGNTITTGKIVTDDGYNYLDLDGNKFRIGDASSSMDYNVTAPNQLTLRNVKLMSGTAQDPIYSDIGVYRGGYNENYTYYNGEEVAYTSNGETATYRYINPTPSSGHAPTNTTYWNVVAKGKKGDTGNNGDFYELRYAKNGSPTSPPNLVETDRNPSGWGTAQPPVSVLEYLWETRAKINGTTGALLTNWTTPIRRNPVDAVNLGENLVDNSEAPENYGITSCTAESPKYIRSGKKMCKILATGTKVSCQVRVTLTGCSPKSGGGQVLVYINGSNSYPTIGEKIDITSSTVTFDLKSEDVTYNVNGGTMYKDINIRLINFNDGGTVTIERVKVEVGSKCTAWSLSEADKRGPAVIYRGVYDSSSVYMGSSLRVDCVKYNGVYYCARYDAGEFSNHAPTDDDYWNSFGAQFESIATKLLLAENANVGGWIFRNNRLESGNGSMFMDGVNGIVRLGGTLLMSAGYGGHENLEDYNIFYLQGVSVTTTIVVNTGVEHIGKVIKIMNTGTFSQGDYKVRLLNFSVVENGGSQTKTTSLNYDAVLRPQEVLEATCFRVPSNDGSIKGSWEITSRFAQTDFKADSNVRGRYSLILGQGKYLYSSGSLTGNWWDNRSIGNILSLTRISAGIYRISFKESDIPSGSYFMVCGNGGTGGGSAVFANVYSISFNGDSSYVEIRTADDDSLNDGGFIFIIFGENWNYPLHD